MQTEHKWGKNVDMNGVKGGQMGQGRGWKWDKRRKETEQEDIETR